MTLGATSPTTIIGRYAIFDEIASGGMATVHYGRLLGPSGFSRTVAIKKLHPHLARDPEFTAMLLDEARVAARVRHPNVVSTFDVVATEGQLFLVMEYVQGESLSRLLRAARKRGERMPVAIAAAIIVGVLHGLHAAHEATDERGQALHIVHRDISPQNILIGLDGIPRLVDFGVAKATGRVQTTREGQLKGKIAYMAPEQIRGAQPTRLVDVYATAIVFWEMLTGERLFGGDNDVVVLEKALHLAAEPPSRVVKEIPPALDAILLHGLDRDPAKRFQSAREMAREIEDVAPLAPVSRIGEWVETIAGDVLTERAAKVAEIESRSEVRIYRPSLAHSSLSSPPPPPDAKVPSKTDLSADSFAAPGASEVGATPTAHSDARRWLILGLVATGVALGTIWFFAVRTSPKAPTPEALSTQVVTATPATTPSQARATTPSASALSPPVTVTITTAPGPVVTAHVATHTAVTATAPASAHGTPKGNCTPPYTLDANGVKQYKLECL